MYLPSSLPTSIFIYLFSSPVAFSSISSFPPLLFSSLLSSSLLFSVLLLHLICSFDHFSLYVTRNFNIYSPSIFFLLSILLILRHSLFPNRLLIFIFYLLYLQREQALLQEIERLKSIIFEIQQERDKAFEKVEEMYLEKLSMKEDCKKEQEVKQIFIYIFFDRNFNVAYIMLDKRKHFFIFQVLFYMFSWHYFIVIFHSLNLFQYLLEYS